MKTSRKIDEELVCADSLKSYLEQRGCKVEVRREVNDPPDFWFTVDGEKFAVEVTSIVESPELILQDYLDKLVEEIRNNVSSISGVYSLTSGGPPDKFKLPKKESSGWNDLVQQITSFIYRTKDLSSSNDCIPEHYLLKDGDAYLKIQKLPSEESAPDMTTVNRLPGWKWESESHLDLQKLVGEAIRNKIKKTAGIVSPKVLVFYDAYGYVGPEAAKKAFLSVPNYDYFHSTFWASSFTNKKNELEPEEPGRVGEMFYSKNKKWMPEIIS